MSGMVEKTENLKNVGKILCLPCSKLVDHPLHFEFYAQSHLEELVRSIGEAGLLEPVVVCQMKDDTYRILNGHYRIRAIRRLRWKSVLCRVIECDERISFIIYCTSNLLVRGLGAIEEAYMISVLIEKENFTLTEIGKIWGRSKSWVSRRLSLLTHLEPKMKNELKHGFLAPRLAQELARLPQGNDQERILKIVRRENMNKDDASQLVTWWLSANEDERRIVAEKGFNGGIKAINNNDSDILARAVAGHFLKIKDILDKLILIIQSRKILDWWPQDEYYSFKKLFLYLDQILLEELTSINGGAE
jgi:ParB/RepB/Spo0J family partition protein